MSQWDLDVLPDWIRELNFEIAQCIDWRWIFVRLLFSQEIKASTADCESRRNFFVQGFTVHKALLSVHTVEHIYICTRVSARPLWFGGRFYLVTNSFPILHPISSVPNLFPFSFPFSYWKRQTIRYTLSWIQKNMPTHPATHVTSISRVYIYIYI